MKTHKINRETHTGRAPGAFTLMELMVSIGILVVIILAVGMTFSGASKAVGMSQATMEEMAAVRATQQLIERDIQSLDRNGYLVIRCRVNNPGNDRSYRFDQLGFMAVGSFANPSGADTQYPFTDSSVAGGAVLWWGQGVLESANPSDATYLSTTGSGTGQGVLPGNWTARLPTGVDPAWSSKTGTWENKVTLMRHPTLLFPGPAGMGPIFPAGNRVMAYDSPAWNTPPITNSNMESSYPADITASRYSAAAMTPAQLLQRIDGQRAGSLDWPEAYLYTYRFRALDSVYDTEVNSNPFVNGYFRTTPIVMRGVSSFRVDWTYGQTYLSNYTGDPKYIGQLVWYGPTQPDPSLANGPLLFGGGAPDSDVEAYNVGVLGGVSLNDQYVAVFNHNNKAKWPKALRISMHVANERIGGRDFVQVVNLPR